MASRGRSLQCRYHPEERAVGVCMRCRSPICTTCRTRVRGVNHCNACLQKLAQPAQAVDVSNAQGFVAATLLSGAGWLLLLLVLYWAQGLLAATPTLK